MVKIRNILISLILFLTILPTIVLAQEWYKDVAKTFFGPEVPSEWVEQPAKFLQMLLLPFFALWAVMFGILSEIRIFRRKEKINILLAFLIAAIAGPTGGLVWLVRVIFVAAGYWGFVVFGVLLIVGITLWAGARFWEWGAPFGMGRGTWAQEASLRFKLQQAYETRAKAAASGQQEVVNQCDDRIKKLEKELKKLKKAEKEEVLKELPEV